jgi:SAM-dependent methyltransferase
MGKHWTEKLFIDNAYLYRRSLEELLERTSENVEGLLKIFSQHNVPKEGIILDLACGVGRHSLLLAENGFKTVGIDISPTFIGRAKELAKERKVKDNTDFRIGDMRQVGELLQNYKESFDVVVNLFTSHGYWDKATDRNIFQQSLSLVKPKGLLIIHTVNRDFLIKNFQARDWNIIQENKLLLVERRLDLESSRMFNVWTYYEQQDKDLKYLNTFELDHRVYSVHELKKLVEDSGWKYLDCYGGYDMQQLKEDSFGMVLVAQRA